MRSIFRGSRCNQKILNERALVLNAGKINATRLILVKPQDYNSEIPSLVKGKIAENIKVSMNFTLEAN